MNAPSDAERSFALALSLWIAAAILAIAALVWIPLQAPLPGAFSDSVDYLVFADWLRAMIQGERTADWLFLQTRYPPLFPFALAAVGAGAANAAPAAWLASALVLSVGLLSTAWFVRECGSRAGLVLAVPVLLNPAWLLAALDPMSEPLFTVLLLTTLLVAGRVANGKTSLLTFALLVGLVPLCRTAGLALVMASVMWLVLRRIRPPRQILLAALLMAAPAGLWGLLRAQYPVVAPYSEDLARALATPQGWIVLLREQPLQMISAALGLLDPWGSAWRSPLLVILPLTLLGLVRRLRQRQLDALFFVIYGGLVAVWPYPAELPRLILVMLPLLLLCAWDGLASLVARWAGPRAGLASAAALAALLVVTALPFLVESASRMATPVEAALEPAKRDGRFLRARLWSDAERILEVRTRTDLAMDGVGIVVSPGDCVYTFYPQALHIHAPRITAVPMPYPRRADQTLREQFAGCRYVLITNSRSSQLREPPLYPWPEIAEFSRPVFTSVRQSASGPEVVAALLQLEEAPVPTPAGNQRQ